MRTNEEDMAVCQKAAEALAEHFDSVQIYVTRHEPAERDGTVNAHYGLGNWYTRYGQVREWVIQQDELTRQKMRNRE